MDPNTGVTIRFTPLRSSEVVSHWTTSMLKTHFANIVAELIAASSFQNAFANIISINAVRCHGQVICKEAESLSDHVSREISRTTSNNLAFLLNYTMWGELLQYIMMATLGIFISQGIIGAVSACQRNCCSKKKPQLSCCGLLTMLIRTTDRYLNPWSSQRHATGQDLIDLSLALQSTDVAAQVLNNRVGLLDTRIDEIFRTLNLPGKYEDPSIETFQKKTVTFQDQDTMENNDENQESYPLIQIHEEPIATSALRIPTPPPKPPRSPYLEMKPKLPPKKKQAVPKAPNIKKTTTKTQSPK